jgi:hypothetical protein
MTIIMTIITYYTTTISNTTKSKMLLLLLLTTKWPQASDGGHLGQDTGPLNFFFFFFCNCQDDLASQENTASG